MRKYVLNIEKLYAGETANALVLKQVDEDMPVLLPSMPERARNIAAWIEKCKRIHPEFDPGYPTTPSGLNQKIMDFNLALQDEFKKRGHDELYMMDDTKWMRPNPSDATYRTDKVNMHLLNGRGEKYDKERQEWVDVDANSSQLNVLFPFRKASSKSLYSEELKVEGVQEVDESLERSRQMTLQGKVTSEKCLQGTAIVGGNLYAMSPLVEGRYENLLANGMTIVNSHSDSPFHFPHTMTLFQPSQDHYDDGNLAKDDEGKTSFIKWYESHNRRTIVSMADQYGENVSNLDVLVSGSYALDLATYGPTGLVLGFRDIDGYKEDVVPFTSEKFREIRAEQDPDNKYEDGKYLFKNGKGTEVGFMFNLYDNFVSGQKRILNIRVPQDKDFNQLHLKFKVKAIHQPGLLGDYEYSVSVAGDGGMEIEKFNSSDAGLDNTVELDIPVKDAVLKNHEFSISIVAHYAVDFAKRENESEYRELLQKSGVVISDIWIDNGLERKEQLTFADYVNEDGLTEEQRKERLSEFWKVSQYKRDIPYQTVLETALKNMSSAGIAYPNNYSTGDIYGDMFTTKSVLDSCYDMNMRGRDDVLLSAGREYVDIGQCSSQLFLVFKPITVEMKKDDSVFAHRGWEV